MPEIPTKGEAVKELLAAVIAWFAMPEKRFDAPPDPEQALAEKRSRTISRFY